MQNILTMLSHYCIKNYFTCPFYLLYTLIEFIDFNLNQLLHILYFIILEAHFKTTPVKNGASTDMAEVA